MKTLTEVEFPVELDLTRTVKPQTNADHIRSLTDEELADYMSEHCIEDFCYLVCGGGCNAFPTFNKTSGMVCREIVSNRLKQPYGGDT